MAAQLATLNEEKAAFAALKGEDAAILQQLNQLKEENAKLTQQLEKAMRAPVTISPQPETNAAATPNTGQPATAAAPDVKEISTKEIVPPVQDVKSAPKEVAPPAKEELTAPAEKSPAAADVPSDTPVSGK
jgi:hypothetical protein